MAKKLQQTHGIVSTKTKTAITQKQSQDVVQFLLYSGLSMLAWVRNFFTDKAFDEQVYNVIDEAPNYLKYATGDFVGVPSTRPRTFMHNLRRGRSRRADAFIDWLETGVFPALRAGNLQALQIYVHTDPDHRDKVVETYTFSIQYRDYPNGKAVDPSSIQLGSVDSQTISLEATNVSLMLLLQHIGRLASQLPDLPAERYVSMRIFLSDDISSEDPPSGFEPGHDSILRFAGAEGWNKKVASLEELSSTFHSIAMKVTHLVHNSTEALSDLGQALPIPIDLTYSIPGIKGEEVESLQMSSDQGLRMQKELGEMMQPEQLTLGETQTQSLARQSHDSHETVHDTRLVLRPSVVTRLTAMKSELRKAACKAIGIPRATPKAHTILCQCEYDQDDDDIVYCSFCNTWQHLHCYGYAGEEDARLPDIHACYPCILGDHNHDSMAGLRMLAAQRRGMCFALFDGLKSKTEFHNMMGNEKTLSDEVFQYLKDNKFVVQASGCHKPGFARTGKPTLVPNMAILNEIIEELFDPQREIAWAFSSPTGIRQLTISKISKQLIALQTKAMPPAATPRSMLSSKPASPDATLNLRRSTTPFTTPARTAVPLGRKHVLEQDSDVVEVPSKRGRSMQTSSVINIDGLSSPIA